jgi:transcriptional regulator with XRE-family HTH domain
MKNRIVKVTPQQLGTQLRVHRKSNGLTQKEVADVLGISQSNFSKMENALLQPSAIQWMSFCQLVEIPFDIALK